jgi:hypothetical protein
MPATTLRPAGQGVGQRWLTAQQGGEQSERRGPVDVALACDDPRSATRSVRVERALGVVVAFSLAVPSGM